MNTRELEKKKKVHIRVKSIAEIREINWKNPKYTFFKIMHYLSGKVWPAVKTPENTYLVDTWYIPRSWAKEVHLSKTSQILRRIFRWLPWR